MAESCQASCSIHRLAIVVAVAKLGLSGVTAHSDANPHRPWPCLGMKGILRGECRPEGVGCAGEDRVKSIAHSLDHVTAIQRDALPHQDIVACKRDPHGSRDSLTHTSGMPRMAAARAIAPSCR